MYKTYAVIVIAVVVALAIWATASGFIHYKTEIAGASTYQGLQFFDGQTNELLSVDLNSGEFTVERTKTEDKIKKCKSLKLKDRLSAILANVPVCMFNFVRMRCNQIGFSSYATLAGAGGDIRLTPFSKNLVKGCGNYSDLCDSSAAEQLQVLISNWKSIGLSNPPFDDSACEK